MSADRPNARVARTPVGEAALLRGEVEWLTRELEQARARIAELEARADVDPLLDIINRRGFERELKRSLAYVKRYGIPAALLYVDLDGFKAINDQCGHAAGDALLAAVAEELISHVRASDVVARLGGDEFGVLMWNAGKPQALMRARDLEMRIDELPVKHDGAANLTVGASVGVAMLSGDLDPAALIDLADKAMYARKKERRG